LYYLFLPQLVESVSISLFFFLFQLLRYYFSFFCILFYFFIANFRIVILATLTSIIIFEKYFDSLTKYGFSNVVFYSLKQKKKITTLLEVISNIVIYIFIHILKEDTSRNKKRKKKKWYIFSFHALVGNFTSSYYEDITSSKDMRSFWVMFVLLCFNLLSVINDPSLLDSQVIVYIYISVYTLLHQELTIDPTWLVTSTVLKSSFYVNA